MIAGVWAPGPEVIAERVLASMTQAVRLHPVDVLRGPGFVLARWSLGVSSAADAVRRLVIVGTTGVTSAPVELESSSRLPGDYALIGARPSGLLLARGRHAGRCLYFANVSSGAVAACSRLEPLIACISDGVAPNVRTLAALLQGQPSDCLSATAFQGVSRVMSSQAILLGLQGAIAKHEAPMEPSIHRGSPDEMAEEIRRLLDRAVQRAIAPARRVAVLVSGGLDSASVLARTVALARGANRAEVDAVTWSVAGPGDDRPYLSEICDALGIVPVRVFSHELRNRVARALVCDAAPSIWPTMAGMLLPQERARERGADLVLTGLGGDHVFDGDTRSLAQHAVAGRWDDAVRASRLLFGDSTPRSILRTASVVLARPLAEAMPSTLRLKRRRYVAQRWPWSGPRLRQTLHEMVVEGPQNHDWLSLTSAPRLQRYVSCDFLHLAETRGQMESVTRLMRVDPLLDDELVTAVAGFPQELLLFGHRKRGLFRHAMRSVLPERLRLRPDKAGLRLGVAETTRGSDESRLWSLAKMELCGDLGLVEPRKYLAHFRRAWASQGPWITLWPALSVEAFLRSHWSADRTICQASA